MRFITRLSAVLVFSTSLLAARQEPSSKPQDAPPTKVEADEFYSGTVAELQQDRVTVLRAILGKPAEKRVFIINADTKVEGKMKAKSRVTVKYLGGDDGDIALTILVRDKDGKKK